ncbi:tetratricopeptide repeat protein [Desulforhopalus sp. 52FAK]
MVLIKKTFNLCGLLFVCCLVACSAPEKDKVEYYQSAIEYIQNDDRQAAIIQLRNALQVDAKYGDAHYQLGLLYLEEKEPRKAFQSLLRAADLLPENLDASLKVAEFYMVTRQTEEARQRIEHILELDPEHLEALTLLANLELVEGNYEESIGALEKIGPKVDTSDTLQNVKGRIFAAQEQWEGAEDAFNNAIALNKENLSNYRTLLLLYQKTQDEEKAKALLNKMVHQFPDDPVVYQLLANYYRSVNNKELLLQQLEKLVEIAPENAGFKLQLSEFYRENNQQEQAESLLSEARAVDGENPDLAAALATLFFDQKRFEESKIILNELEKTHPGHGGVKLVKARFLLNEAKTRDGLNLLQELNKDFPEWAEPYFYLSLAHLELQEVDLAQNAVELAIQKYGRNAKYHTLLAQIFQTQGSFEDAMKEAIIALRLNPKNIRSALILSRALIDLKKYEQAIQLLDNINSQVAGNVEVLGNLAVAHLGQKEDAKAERYLVELLDLQPGNTQAVMLLLNAKFKNELSGGEEFVGQQIEAAPENERLYLVLAEILIRQEKFDEALLVYTKLQELQPGDVKAYMAEAQLLRKLSKNDEAMARYTTVLEKWPNTIAAHMGSADLLQLEGKNAEAMNHYRKVLKLKEDFSPAANNLAWLVASDPDGDLGEALMLAMRAKQVNPDSPAIADTLGWVHLKRESYSLAKTQFEFALEKAPDHPTMRYHLALALRGGDQPETSVEVLERLLSENVEFPEREDAEKLLNELKQ